MDLGTTRRTVDRLVGIALASSGVRSGDALPSLIESHPLGWWYSAGLPCGSAIAVFFTDVDICSKMMLTRREQLFGLLGEALHTRQRFESSGDFGNVRVFPAGSHCLENASGDSWLAIGDAALGRDPLSSSGIDFALASAERAYEAICSMANGRTGDLEYYNMQVQVDFQDYLTKRDSFYGIEDRWLTSPFWRRREAVKDGTLRPLEVG